MKLSRITGVFSWTFRHQRITINCPPITKLSSDLVHAPFLYTDFRHIYCWIYHCALGSRYTVVRACHFCLGSRGRRTYSEANIQTSKPNTASYTLLILAQIRTAKGAAILTVFFILLIIPAERIAAQEALQVRNVSAKTQPYAHMLLASESERDRHLSTRTVEAPRIFLATRTMILW